MKLKSVAAAFAFLACSCPPILAAPLGMAFTYQGRLTDSGQPANGIYDLRFTIYDALVDGIVVGGPLTNTATSVSNGLFTVTLDFGSSVFASDARWLEVGVRTNGTGAFETFPTRQALTATPYALFAANAGTAAVASSVAGNSITALNIASGQVVKSLNGLTDSVTLVAGANVFVATNGNTLTLSAAGAGVSGGWTTTGNAGTSPATNFLGTTDNQPLELRVNGQRALWLAPTTNSPNVIAGASNNIVDGGAIGATIAGGGSPCSAAHYGVPLPQRVSASFTTIAGGLGNIVEGYGSTVSGGEQNWIRSWTPNCAGSTIAGGGNNSVGSQAGSVGGGVGNGVMGNMAVVAGGLQNRIGFEGHLSAIGGGFFNFIRTNGDYIAAGAIPNAQAAYIGGGISNLAMGFVSTISGGCANTNAANFSVLGGGYYNDIQRYSDAAVIGGGIGNGIQAAQDAVIAGGWLNVVQNNASAAAIGGGYGNLIQTNAFRATIGGGMGNTNGGRHAVVGGGQENTVIGEAAFIGGGTRNFAFSDSTAIGGGSGNTILINSAYSTIGGGRENKVVGNAGGSTIGGGVYNLINDETTLSTIGGGASNRIGSANSYVTIAGGFNNFNGGLSSTIGGGTDNTISHAAFLATIPGGTENYAGAGYTFAAGRRAQANHTGAFVWADSTDADFASTRDDQFNIRAAGGVFVQSDRGIGLNAADRPLITRGFDLFDASAPPEKQGLGRWGLFMEPFNLVLGIPGDDTPGRNFQVGKYARDGSWIGLMLVDQSGLVQARIFNPTSDRAAKENFTPVNASEVLEKLAALPLSEWNFKQDASAHHLGPVAQDFYAAFGLGTDDKHISTVDADGVALAAIQGLNQKVESENAALRDELRGKEAELEALKARLEALERRFTP